MRSAAQQRSLGEVRFQSRDKQTPTVIETTPQLHRPARDFGPSSRVSLARTGDLIDIHHFLSSIFQGPSAAEFQAQQDAPGYDPSQRLIVRDRHELMAHARVTPVVDMQYGAATISAAWLMDLATATPFRRQGLATELVAAAEQEARRRGAAVLFARSSVVDFLTQRGWHVCGRHSYSLVDACRLLAFLAERRADRMTSIPTLGTTAVERLWYVRPFRMLDLPELMQLEEVRTAGRFGALTRDRATWEWLLARRAFDQFYVACDGPNATELAGYAVVCGSRVVELVAKSHSAAVSSALLTRVAEDAVEESVTSLRLDAAPDDPLHGWFQAAKGRTINTILSGGEAYCVKVLQPQTLLQQTAAVWQQRAQSAKERSGTLTLELSATQPAESLKLVLDPETGAVLADEQPGRKTKLQLPCSQLGPLVLGQMTQEENARALSLASTDSHGATRAKAFFPPVPLYFPSLEQLTARE